MLGWRRLTRQILEGGLASARAFLWVATQWERSHFRVGLLEFLRVAICSSSDVTAAVVPCVRLDGETHGTAHYVDGCQGHRVSFGVVPSLV